VATKTAKARLVLWRGWTYLQAMTEEAQAQQLLKRCA
jgi:hypothetical protein